MNKIISQALIGISFIFLNFSCNFHNDYSLKFDIINKSDSPIYFAFSYSYPDTSPGRIDFVPYINGNQTHKIQTHDGKSETRDVFLEPTTLVFIFDAQTIETTPWDSIVKHYKVLKRYQLTKNDMEKMNWTITYP